MAWRRCSAMAMRGGKALGRRDKSCGRPWVGEAWCQRGAKGSWSTAYHPAMGVTRKPRQIARLASLGPAELAPARDS